MQICYFTVFAKNTSRIGWIHVCLPGRTSGVTLVNSRKPVVSFLLKLLGMAAGIQARRRVNWAWPQGANTQTHYTHHACTGLRFSCLYNLVRHLGLNPIKLTSITEVFGKCSDANGFAYYCSTLRNKSKRVSVPSLCWDKTHGESCNIRRSIQAEHQEMLQLRVKP